MKNLSVLLVLLLAVVTVNAQTAKPSAASELDKSAAVVLTTLVDETENCVYVLRGQAWASYIDYTLEKYDKATMKLLYLKVIYPTEKRKFFQNSWYVNMYILNNKPYLLFKDKPQKEDVANYFLIEIDKDGNEVNRIAIASKAEKKQIITMKGSFPVDERIITTTSKERPFIFLQCYDAKGEFTEQFTFLNDKLEVIDEKTLEIPKLQYYYDLQCAFNDKTGEMYVVTNLADRLGSGNNTMCMVHKMDKDGKFSEVKCKLGSGNWLADAKLFYDGGEPLLLGVSMHQTGDDVEFKGFFTQELTSISEINNPKIYPFGDEMNLPAPKGHSEAIQYCRVDSVYEGKDDFKAVFIRHCKYSNRDGFPVTIYNQMNITCFDGDDIKWTYNANSGDNLTQYYYTLSYFKQKGDDFNVVMRSYSETKDPGYYLLKFDSKGGLTETTIKGTTTEDMMKNYSQDTGKVGEFDKDGDFYLPWHLRYKKSIKLVKFDL
ncbi:MAG: hypothetical protein M0D57_05500 [Sphingobacteriales bacterium JAD_PAG50586_3]|nr:MAG: hypothetical protein M0D57_05500 [Sphingobacteriales bacterium JAD_PAG50586_3]